MSLARSLASAAQITAANRPVNDVQPRYRQTAVALKMHDLKMTDKLLANCEHNYGVWKMQEYKSKRLNSAHLVKLGVLNTRGIFGYSFLTSTSTSSSSSSSPAVQLRQPQHQLMPRRRGRHVKSASWLRVTASCWCLAGTRFSVLSVLTPWPLCQMAVRCFVHLLTWLCVCIFDVYLANYRKTLLELD